MYFDFFPVCEQDCANVGFLPSPPNPDLITSTQVKYQIMIFEDLNCLSKCKVLEPDCFSLLYTDYYNAGGVCAGSYADVVQGWPVSSQTCQMEDVSSTWNWVQEGLCRPETEKAMIQPQCVREGFI